MSLMMTETGEYLRKCVQVGPGQKLRHGVRYILKVFLETFLFTLINYILILFMDAF
jgi:hypothetical protein